MDALTERNILALSQGLKDLRAELSTQNKKLEDATNTISTLAAELNNLRALVIATMGKTVGPTA